ncbi:energy-coupling factor transporter ATPase [Staphylococcus hyicus]|uniref:energy-coupling factor transporter ATPase n=1 Tax=Staphylococcus hyicus TaxID=1284 RepID=UPI00057DAA51|nr:energy-coupling factor transporter ATPase [Staphylococcus hyicus]AJC95461.1 cobalt transporter ATP-binding subunit [Staphylococcus hyicus]MCE5154013.1 energy-coupling factor transporter ATPase [Staphylococcus hyicus]MCQ9291467.1 energy-coupling factor transporter ATPase [Staphylococcus hyicus]MCQ9300364.1 energy-coupling factor transporter ATPase [Staphylococcus hyicus]MCQ9306708.1 energy-coupling factor transporter ATPase [Staphylococcus hyicus]
MQPIIAFENVSFKYDTADTMTLKNITFSVNHGEWVSIVGHNGSGKSTLTKLITGIETDFEGDLLLNGKRVNAGASVEFRQHIGVVFQNPENQFVGSTVKYDVAFGLENRCTPYEKMQQIVPQALKDVDMYDKQNHEPTALSGGQKQRVAIAGVLALNPKLIILDEATSMLDPEGKAEILKMMRKMNHEWGVTVLSITHDLSEVVDSDKVIVMNQGQVALEGDVRNIFNEAERLKQLGLDLPFEMRIAQKLQLDTHLVTYDALVERLL